MNITRCPLVPKTIFLPLTLAVGVQFGAMGQNIEVRGQDTTTDSESGAITSKKDEVDLVGDANLDDAVQRRPDLNFSNLTLNQEKSSLNLSEIPAEAVKKAEVLKAVTPDMDADTRGGSLNVNIKPAYDLEKSSLKGKLYSRYKSIYDLHGPIGVLTWASPISENSGLRLTGEYQDVVRGHDSLRMDWSNVPSITTGDFYLDGVDMLNNYRDYHTYRFNGSFDHRLSDLASIYFRANWNLNEIDSTGSAVQYRYGAEADFDQLSSDAGFVSDGRVRREGRRWFNRAETLSYILGGDYKKENLVIEWRLQRTEESNDNPMREVTRFEDKEAAIGYEAALTRFPKIIDLAYEDSSGFFLSGYEDANDAQQRDTDVAAADGTWKPDWIGSRGYLKFGAKYSSNKVDFRTETDVYQINSSVAPDMTGFVSDFRRDDFIGRGFDHGITPEAAEVSEFLALNPNVISRDSLISALRSDPATFNANEDIQAAYVSANYYTGNWRFLIGVRYESTDLHSSGSEVVVEGSEFEIGKQNASNDYQNWFPGLHARYRVNPRFDVIGSFTQTIKRPPFSETAPYRIVATDTRTIEEGNPEAQAMIFDNLDLAFDFQPVPETLVSWEWFYRSVADSLFTRTSTISGGPFEGYRLERLENGGDSTLWGSKITYQQDLGIFSEVLKPYSWNVVYTYSQSDAEYEFRPKESLPLTNIPEHRLLAALSAETEKTYVQLSVDFRSESLSRVSTAGSEKDRYASNWRYINLLAEYKLNDMWTAFLDWENLEKNFEDASDEGINRRPFDYKWDPWKIFFGLRFDK